MAVTDYNITPVSNSAISGIDISEGCNPAGINDAIRQMMADIRVMYNSIGDDRRLENVAALIDDTNLTYTTGSEYTVAEGEYIATLSEEYVFKVAASTATDHDIATSNGTPVKLYVIAAVYEPEMFSKMSTNTERTSGLNAALQKCVADQKPGRSSGDYSIDGTIAPGGLYSWDWGQTRLLWAGSDITTLTELQENPSGASYSGAGKYVLFDTAGCEASVNSGSLTIRGTAVGNMNQASIATLESNLVAISCSTGTSEEITWDFLYLLGCGYGLWQGDMSGTATAILPYTRWNVGYLEIRNTLVAAEGGSQGNCFDDGSWSNIHFARNDDNGVVRTDLICDVLFIKGKRFSQDAETWTASTSGTTVTTSAAHGLSAGDIIAIDGAADNLGGSAIPLVSRVSSVTSSTVVEVETSAANSVSGASVIVGPPQFRLASADLIAQHIYVEEIHDNAIRCADSGRVECPDFKVSDGNFGARYGVGLILTGFNDPTADIRLNQRTGKNNDNLRHIVGVATLQSGSAQNSCSVSVVTKNAEADFVNLSVVGGVKLESDHAAGNTTSAGIPEAPEQSIHVRYTSGWRAYQASMHGAALPMQLWNGKDFPTPAPSLRSNANMTGVTGTGNCAAPSGGSASKTSGATGFWYEDVDISPGDLLVIDLEASSLTTTGVQVVLLDSSGAGAGTVVYTGAAIRLAAGGRTYIKVPSGSTADRIGLQCFSSAVVTMTKFDVRKVVDAVSLTGQVNSETIGYSIVTDGTATMAIAAEGGGTTTRTATGAYTFTFTETQADTNYLLRGAVTVDGNRKIGDIVKGTSSVTFTTEVSGSGANTDSSFDVEIVRLS